jgi:replicative DNA helicase
MEFFKKNIDYDLDIEKSVLGIFTIEPNSFGSVYGILSADCFYDANHKAVYDLIERYWKDGGQIDLLTIAHQFHSQGKTDIGGQTVGFYLSGLSMNVVSSAHLRTWCLILRELYAKRIMHMATHGGITGDNIFETAQKIQAEINKAFQVKATEDWVSGEKLHAMMSEKMTKSAQEGNSGISTSINKIDERNGGFKPGQMIVIAARPGIGKSALMGSIATNAATNGSTVGVISLEMPVVDIFSRIVSAETNVPFKSIDKNLLFDEAQKNLVYSKIATLSRLPIFFSETAQVSIFDIRAKAEQLQRRSGLDMLVIDYLQLIESTGISKNSNRENEVSKISRGIKLLAMDLKIPVIVLAQLNRNVESRTGKSRYPILSDLRESGSIEQDADVVIFLHSDFKSGHETDESGNSTESERDAIVAKWRNGESDLQVKLKFDGPTMKFSEIDHYPTISDKPNSPALKSHYEVERDEAPF